jgi:cytochrome P450 / NADPH-cytochrome P450 reductase
MTSPEAPPAGALAPIPHPPKKPFVGNMFSVGGKTPVQDLVALARELGPIFQLDIMGKPITVVSGFPLVDELSDESRFDKSVRGALHRVRTISGDGLFTAYTSEPNWSRAHNILLPNFGDRAMQGYHPMMLDVAEQLMLKWARLNPDDEVDVVHDMTALTLDTIGICGFGYRFNSFYREDNHPFVDAMVDALEIAMSTRGLPFEDVFTRARQARLQADAVYLNGLVDRIVRERKEQRAASGDAQKTDLLDYMLTGVDRKSGERLGDENIRYQIITFLIAGHETTSGLLSFATYYLLQNPDVLERAYDEVDRILGTDPSVKPTMRQVNALTYVQQILKETLRLWPTAPAFGLLPYKDEVIGGKYPLKARAQVMILLPALHRDRGIWGERAEAFDPDNFRPDRERARPLNAYKPFGNGQRACIGRQFAMQEATLVIGMILQRFRLIDHLRYQLRVKETLTLKPEGLKIKVRPRAHKSVVESVGNATASAAVTAAPASARSNGAAPSGATPVAVPSHGTPLLVLFGSNLGTSEEIARSIGDAAAAQGFAVQVGWLDDYAGKLPTQGGVLIVCASYNGTPPDNAAGFYRWLQDGMAPNALAGVRYTVFGCGNRNWASTYQAVPRFLDEKLAEFGAERLFQRGEGDAQEDIDAQARRWRVALWQHVAKELGIAFDARAETDARPRYELEVVAGPQANPLAAVHGATAMRVVVNRELQTGDQRSTRHIEVALPADAAYGVGDHLGVVAENPPAVVERAMRRFGFAADTYVRLRAGGGARTPALPVGVPLAVERLLAHYVELQHTATRNQVAILAEHTQCPSTKPKLLGLAASEADSDAYQSEVKRKHRSVLDLLEEHPACELPFETFLGMLAPMTPRYYSISSSPLVETRTCSITVGVVREPAWSGLGTFEGACSTYLSRHAPGQMIDAFVKDSKSGFRLPDDPLRPIVMIGPGTGLAPFRGFMQERDALRRAGTVLGRALLFFGCRHPDQDYLYRDELERYAADGIVELHVAFSRLGAEKTYVQHRIAERADDVWSVLEDGGVVYVCGDGSRMEPDVRAALAELYGRKTGADAAAANAWLDALTASKRYNLDVWGST